jgi:RNA polymerase sigma-70 factor (ECF subfamily)
MQETPPVLALAEGMLQPASCPELNAASNTTPTPSADTADAHALFRQLVQDHRTRLYRFIVKNIGHGTDAEDLAQQAFVEAAKAYETFRGASELSTWLYGIAMNLVRNYLSRAPHRRYTFETDDALDDTHSDRPDPSEQLEQSQAVRLLQREIDGLPTEMREVLLLVALEELSYEEAAVMLAIPVGTVRSRVSRARSTLRKRMADAHMPLDF